MKFLPIFYRQFLRRFFAVFFILPLSFSCSHAPAKIVNKSSEFYDNKINKQKYSELESEKKVTKDESKKPAIVVSEAPAAEKTQTINLKNEVSPVKNKEVAVTKNFTLRPQDEQVEVVAGDTLYSISRKNQTTQEEIIKLNNLTPPYALKSGTKLTIRKVPANVLAAKSAQKIEVSAGDNLLKIAKDYQVTLRDLIRQNKLTPPYNLKVGQKLTIPAPNYHEVQPGETLYAISRLHNMKVDELIRMNDLKEPYAVKVGEKIRITNINDEAVVESVKAPQVTEAPVPKKAEKTEVKIAEKSEKKSEVVVEKQPTVADKNNKFVWPIAGKIISKFGPKSGGLYNDGINIKAVAGAPVKSAEEGVVAYVGSELKGYGNLVIVKHSGGWITAYAHLSDTTVKRGQKVSCGEKIGAVGATGNVKSPQLYFGLRKGRDAVNPENYLKK